jgi:hypothetical protein
MHSADVAVVVVVAAAAVDVVATCLKYIVPCQIIVITDIILVLSSVLFKIQFSFKKTFNLFAISNFSALVICNHTTR